MEGFAMVTPFALARAYAGEKVAVTSRRFPPINIDEIVNGNITKCMILGPSFQKVNKKGKQKQTDHHPS